MAENKYFAPIGWIKQSGTVTLWGTYVRMFNVNNDMWNILNWLLQQMTI